MRGWVKHLRSIWGKQITKKGSEKISEKVIKISSKVKRWDNTKEHFKRYKPLTYGQFLEKL